ncbi:MAG: hypothetical protein JWM76_394 [Pseudonocardiales bacterium]|nr:hypothetical protein [Pseudonocardiales bacterium]
MDHLRRGVFTAAGYDATNKVVGAAILAAHADSAEVIARNNAIDTQAPTDLGTYLPLVATTAWTTCPLSHGMNWVDASSGAKTVSLPTPLVAGEILAVEKADTGTNTVAISGTIRGSVTTVTLSLSRGTVVFEAESLTSWRPFAGHKTLSSLDARFLAQPATAAALLDQVAGYDSAATPAIAVVHERRARRPRGWLVHRDRFPLGGRS